MPNIVLMSRYYKPVDVLSSSNPIISRNIKNRNYYSSKNKDGNDYIKYIETGIKKGNDFDYMDYMSCHEESTGVFSRNGLLTKEEKADIRKKLRTSESVIWDLVISFEEAYGLDKVNNVSDAIDILNHSLPKLFRDNGMDVNNIIWFAGLHKNTDNRHIHISFFEIEPKFHRANKSGLYYHNGPLRGHSLDSFKVYTEEYLNGNKYFFEHNREALVEGTLNLLASSDINKVIKYKLARLHSLLPKGKCFYGSKNMDGCRALVDEISYLIIKNNPELKKEYISFIKDLNIKDKELEDIALSQHLNPDDYKIGKKYIADFERRIGNKVIEYAKEYELEESFQNKTKKNQASLRRMEKRLKLSLLSHAARLNKMVEYEASNALKSYRQLIKEAEKKRLEVDGGIEAE